MAGIVLMAVGVVLLWLSFTTLDWYPRPKVADAVQKIDFVALHHNLDTFPAPGPTKAYFTWLAWVLLIVLILVAFAANVPTKASDGLRLTGFFLGLVGAAFTYYALSRYAQAQHDLHGSNGDALDHAQIGIWFAFGGYLLAGAGAAIGPRRAKKPRTKPGRT